MHFSPIVRTLALAVASACGVSHAAAPPPPANPVVAPAIAPTALQAPVVPLLWKVSDADNSVYLLGSFHLLKVDDKPITPAVEAAFADAESVMFEVPPAQLTDPATATKFQAAMLYTGGRTLSKTLPPQTLKKLEAMLAPSKMPVAALDPLEPWAVSLQLALGIMMSQGFLADQGVDKVLMARAAQTNKPTTGLETIDDQLRALDGTPESEQIKSLDEFVADPKKGVEESMALHRAWRAGDAAWLDTGFRGEMARELPATYKLLNVDRNVRWVPQIEARLRAKGTGDTLVVVGALHLVGKDGLVERLRAKGYTVERIGYAATGKAAKGKVKGKVVSPR